MPDTLLQSNRYKKFVQDRDKVLEQIHQNTQLDLSRILYGALEIIEGSVASLALRQHKTPYEAFALSQHLETTTLTVFTAIITPMLSRIQRMRRAVYTMTYLSEREAIGQATQKTHAQSPFEFKHQLQKQELAKTLNGDDLSERIWIALMRIRNKILDAFRLGLVQNLRASQLLQAVKDSYPKIDAYKRPPRELKPFQEASRQTILDDEDEKKEISSDFVDDTDWNLAVSAYKDTELPSSRFDQEPVYDPEAGYRKYNWEMEQDLTDDFVNQVRQGQVDAANALGIQDFVWVAVIDNKTDACCLARNGKTTSEIQSMLSQGKLDEDICDATSPPAHPNCRCQLAPVASTDEVEGPDWASFNDWLNS